jgi:hypothetical protein
MQWQRRCVHVSTTRTAFTNRVWEQHTIAQLQAAIEHEDTHQGRHHWLLQFSAVCEQIDAIIEDEKQQRRQREEPAVRG